ncbi:RNA-binding protein 7-like [Astyanax mexicanus]|uniref:RNA binding motif protein 7 n=1 Tax=Astyanax mexicanus TaxID=7994 RepID=A0A8B9L812_ASTMX|nr:RNA-binding protein 7-like [Astyanax mexicanus]
MGIADEADRTLFVGNLDPQVTEELLFELFLQAGPLVKVKIPNDNDGKSKQFAFVNFKHEVSVPYCMNLLNGVRLYGRQLNIQYRAGSSHINQEGKSPANSQNSSPVNSPNHRGGRYDRTPDQMSSPSYSPPQNLQRSFSSPDTLQRQAMMNNMLQVRMHQMQQLNGAFQLGLNQQPQQQQFRGGNGSPWHQESPPYRGHRHQQQDNSGYHSRDHRHGSSHRHDSQRSDFYQHDDRGGGRSRDYPPDRRRDYGDGGRDRRWK